MTNLSFGFPTKTLYPNGRNGFLGTVKFEPVTVRGKTAGTRPPGFTARIPADGKLTVSLEPSTTEWVWKLNVVITYVDAYEEYVVIPDTENADYETLNRIDPSTILRPSDPEDGWWAMAGSTVDGGQIVGDDLVLTRRNGATVNAGNVRGGKQGVPGPRGLTGRDGSNVLPTDQAILESSNALGVARAENSLKGVRLVGGAIRNVGAPDYWQPIIDAWHAPFGFEVVSTSGASITLNTGFGKSGSAIGGTVMAVVDETMAIEGWSAGCSGGGDGNTIVYLHRNKTITERIAWNGTAWVTDSNRMTVSWDSVNAILVITHEAIFDRSGINGTIPGVSLLPHGTSSAYVVPVLAGWSDNSISVKFYTPSGTLITTPTTSTRFIMTRHDTATQINPQTAIDTTTSPSHNIWLFAAQPYA